MAANSGPVPVGTVSGLSNYVEKKKKKRNFNDMMAKAAAARLATRTVDNKMNPTGPMDVVPTPGSVVSTLKR